MDLAKKRIWLIGASEGIGRELAKVLAKRGAYLLLSARGEERLQSLLSELEGKGDHEIACCDVNDQASLNAAYTSLSTTTPIDAAIYLAGIYDPMAWEEWDIEKNLKTIDVNLAGAFRTVETLRPAIDAGTLKKLVLFGSVAGYRGLPKSLSYGATKAAINHFAEGLRIDLDGKETQVQLVSPGFVATRLTDKNDFDMPMRISPEDAAIAIANGLEGNAFEIHFPKKFTYLMKTLRILPHTLYFMLARKL